MKNSIGYTDRSGRMAKPHHLATVYERKPRVTPDSTDAKVLSRRNVIPKALAPPQEQPRVERAGRLRDETEAFLRQVFAQGRHLEEAFRRICDDGCSREEFGMLLYVHCLVSSFRAHPLYFPGDRGRLVNSGNVSRSQLKATPRKIRAMADTIDSINGTILAPANALKLVAYDASRQVPREHLIRMCETLPGLLRFYSWQLERVSKFAARAVKRLTPGHVNALELVRYVDDGTGSPHYDDVSNLFEEGWRVAGRTEEVPPYLSTAGLAKLYQRWATTVCGPRLATRS